LEAKLADRNVTVLPLSEAAALLRLPPTAVEALVGSGYLLPSAKGPSGPEFTLPDLKAFLARNADNGSGNLWRAEPTLEELERVDPQDLLDALDGRADEMAKRVFDIFSTVFPEAATWGITKQARFIEQARSRFEAILAVTGQGAEVDEALVGDLQEVGASAASAGSPLPQLLVILRISRDLVVQTAVELAEERSRHWGLALSLLLTRVLPAMDRLTDALAQGYWAAILGREEEIRARYQNVVEHASDGVYEVDLDGKIKYANPSLALILGHPLEKMEGAHLADIIRPIDPTVSIEALMVDRDGAPSRLIMNVVRADGIRRVLDVQAVPRKGEGGVVGFQGIVRDDTAERDLAVDKNEFLALVTHDLRTPLTTILGLGATIESHAEELPVARMGRMGGSIRRQAERIARLADDLYDVSRLEAHGLLLSPRPVDLAAVVEAALGSVSDTTGVEVRAANGTTVLADPRRLQQIIANLVENAIEHGAAPVVVEVVEVVETGDDSLVLAVTDAGEGVSEALVPTLFSGLRTLGRTNRDRARGTGLGLALVRGLVEAMGGRVWYEPAAGGGASFRLAIPTPRRRP
jgi:PAS domain S-box-containing protein